MKRKQWMHVGLIVAVGCVVGAAWALPPIPAYVVVRQGDTLGVSTVSTLNSPFTDGNGRVGFVGSLADNQRFIWWNTGPVFFSNDALPDVLTGGESTMGVSDTGGFIYSPSVNGNDAVHTHAGTLLQKGDPIPPLPGLFSSFNSRPTMLPNGTAYWVGGSTPTQGSSTSTNRHLFKATDPSNPASITRVLGGGDLINGIPIKTSASNFDYWISDDGLHHIHVLDMDTGSTTNNEHIYLDGAFVAQEGHSAGGGELWQSFDIVGVNNAGNYIFTGDTDGAVATDEFLAYNGVIAVREGDTLDGHTLLSGYALRAASINNLGGVVHMWGLSADEHLFYGLGNDLANSVQLLQTNDEIDTNGDGVSDYLVTDFKASTTIGPGLCLAEDGFVYVEVGLVPIGSTGEIEAILRLAVPEPGALTLLALLGVLALRRR